MKKSIYSVLIGSCLLLSANTAYGLEHCDNKRLFMKRCMRQGVSPACEEAFDIANTFGCVDDLGLPKNNFDPDYCGGFMDLVEDCRQECLDDFNENCPDPKSGASLNNSFEPQGSPGKFR